MKLKSTLQFHENPNLIISPYWKSWHLSWYLKGLSGHGHEEPQDQSQY